MSKLILQWATTNSVGIQAIAALVASIVGVAGFIVLCKYAWDTRTIAKATAFQAKDNVTPFLALSLVPSKLDHRVLQWWIQNHGFGPAVNVRHWLLDGSAPTQRPSIMQGTDALICELSSAEGQQFTEWLNDGNIFKVEYESIAGEHFRSTFQMVEAGKAEVKFENLSRGRAA